MRFEVCAATYDQHATAQRWFAGRVAEFAEIPPGASILELGAGTGALTEHLCAIPNARVHATDLAPAMVAIGAARLPGARWSVVDAFSGDLPPASLQVSSGLLQWASDPVAVLRRWRRALADNGQMVHAFPCEPCLHEWRAIVRESPVEWRDEEQWRKIFESAGLRVIQKQLWTREHQFASAHQMLRSMHDSGVTGGVRISLSRLRASLREYETRFRSDSGVRATWAWLGVKAALS